MSDTTWPGCYKGICTNNVDPEGFSRIKATCPQVFGNHLVETDWAWPIFPSGWGEQSGYVVYYSGGSATPPDSPITRSTPNPGVGVWLVFEGGDEEHPVYLGVRRLVD